MASPCWVTQTSETEAARVFDRACGLVFGQASEPERGDQNSTSASEERQNRQNTKVYELGSEPMAEGTLKDPGPVEA